MRTVLESVLLREHLRRAFLDLHPQNDAGAYLDRRQLCGEALDEIERLRTALKTVGDDYPGSSCQKWCYEQAGLTQA